ncbi:type III pantothenate kinase [Virgibacillus sp. MSJ-26]|uniref:type III pantothenate kinase n=1 Tax=Virgibacillus sp. MSJ-26 TaxID=2841522 RepID=UPI001C105EE4|nr:type III pantothenate kinase [Virgibacillus sp. MSJ-26]MBU5468676.1 type III pantothenate kinase [Virgibacillus sp. MSJ-26]
MLFVIDVGNTNTVLGVFENKTLEHEWRIRTDRHKTEDELGMLMKSLLEHKGISFKDINGVIISSVVPPIMFALEKMCKIYFNIEPLIVGRETIDSSLKKCYPNPHEIGADRIVNAVGAIEEYGSSLVIIDFGTATTYCYVNENEEYAGGIISPGITISMDALYKNASKLPKIEIESPKSIIGKSTVEAMQSGVFYGFVGQVDGIIKRIKESVNNEVTVIATGGLASLIADGSEEINHVDKHLTLKGLQLIYEQNKNN